MGFAAGVSFSDGFFFILVTPPRFARNILMVQGILPVEKDLSNTINSLSFTDKISGIPFTLKASAGEAG